MSEPITPEQFVYAIANIINLSILCVLAWTIFCDWIEDRFIASWKERMRREHGISE